MRFLRETDPMLRRFERNQVLVCVALAAVAAIAGRFDVAAGVVGGSLLMAIGYGGIKAVVNALTASAIEGKPGRNGGSGSRKRLWGVVKFAASYALLALAAYVMLTCLHLHPLGIVLGASTPVISAAIEVVATARRPWRAGHSK